MWLSPLTRFKLVAALLVFIAGWGGVALPWALRRLQSGERYLSLANVLSAGVMLGGGLLHLLPDAAAEVSEAWHGEYPLGYLLFTLGLLLPLVVETLVDVDPGSSSTSAAACCNEDEWATPLQEQHAADASEVTLCCSSGCNVNGKALGEECDAEAVGAEGLPISRPVPLSSAMVLLGALSFHSVLEGLAQGTATSLETSAVLLSAILLHKGCNARPPATAHQPMPTNQCPRAKCPRAKLPRVLSSRWRTPTCHMYIHMHMRALIALAHPHLVPLTFAQPCCLCARLPDAQRRHLESSRARSRPRICTGDAGGQPAWDAGADGRAGEHVCACMCMHVHVHAHVAGGQPGLERAGRDGRRELHVRGAPRNSPEGALSSRA